MTRVLIIISPDGRCSFNVKEGAFEQGEAAITGVFGKLAAGGLTFAEIGPVENHRHDDHHAVFHQHHETHPKLGPAH